MTIEDKRRSSIFGSRTNYYEWAKEWNTVRSSLRCAGKDLSKIKIECVGGKNDGQDEEN